MGSASSSRSGSPSRSDNLSTSDPSTDGIPSPLESTISHVRANAASETVERNCGDIIDLTGDDSEDTDRKDAEGQNENDSRGTIRAEALVSSPPEKQLDEDESATDSDSDVDIFAGTSLDRSHRASYTKETQINNTKTPSLSWKSNTATERISIFPISKSRDTLFRSKSISSQRTLGSLNSETAQPLSRSSSQPTTKTSYEKRGNDLLSNNYITNPLENTKDTSDNPTTSISSETSVSNQKLSLPHKAGSLSSRNTPAEPGSSRFEQTFQRKRLRRASIDWRAECKRTTTLRRDRYPLPPRHLVPKKPLGDLRRLDGYQEPGIANNVRNQNTPSIWDFTIEPLDKEDRASSSASQTNDTPEKITTEVENLGREWREPLHLRDLLEMGKDKDGDTQMEDSTSTTLENEDPSGNLETNTGEEGKDHFLVPEWVLKSIEDNHNLREPGGAMEMPSFLTPQAEMLYIEIDGQIFALYEEFLRYHSPILYQTCSDSRTQKAAATPRILRGFNHKIIALLIQWMYSAPSYSCGLLNKNGQVTYQDRLIKLWVLGKRLNIPRLQSDAMNALNKRMEIDRCLGLMSMEWMWDNTVEGDEVRNYFVDLCAENLHKIEEDTVNEWIPNPMMEKIEERIEKKILKEAIITY